MAWYETSEIKKIFKDKIDSGLRTIFADRELTDSQISDYFTELRIFQRYADEIIADLEEIDRKKAEEEAARKAKEAAEKAAREAKEGGSQ